MEEFFTNVVVMTIASIAVFFFLADRLCVVFPLLKKYHVPLSIIAGLLGMVIRNLMGEEILSLQWVDAEVLKIIVYHGLALVFIAIGLQIPVPQTKNSTNKDAISFSFGISSMGALQGFIGMLIVMGWTVLRGSTHPGIGLLLPLGFNQGPGQALTFGAAWEKSGLQYGADLGLVMATFGFLWAIFVGIPLVMYGKNKGWLDTVGVSSRTPENVDSKTEISPTDSMLPAIAKVLCVYVFVFLLLKGATVVLVNKPKILDLLWGLHFIIALLCAISVRKLFFVDFSAINREQHNERMTGIANFAVDITTMSGLLAMEFAVLAFYAWEVAIVTTLGGIVTLFAAVFLFRRVFAKDAFAHLVLWFGTATGTMPIGMSLLRMIDPQLRSSAPQNITMGAAFALVTSFPNILILSYAVNSFPEDYPKSGWISVGLLLLYCFILLVLWKKIVGWQGITHEQK